MLVSLTIKYCRHFASIIHEEESFLMRWKEFIIFKCIDLPLIPFSAGRKGRLPSLCLLPLNKHYWDALYSPNVGWQLKCENGKIRASQKEKRILGLNGLDTLQASMACEPTAIQRRTLPLLTKKQHAMKFKYRTENNSRFVNVWMKYLVHESWKIQGGRLHRSRAKTTCISVCDSEAPYLLMVIWKGISQEDLLAPSTHHPRMVLCTQKWTDESFFFSPPGGCPSLMHANECKRYKGISLPPPRNAPSCATFSSFTQYCISALENSFANLFIYSTDTKGQQNEMWMRRSPRIAVCVTGTGCADFRMKAAAVEWGEIHSKHARPALRCILDSVSGFLHPLYWRVSGICFSSTDVEKSAHKKCFLLMRPLIQIPHKLDFCFTLCGSGPGFNPFHIPDLLWWASPLWPKLKKKTKVQCWRSSNRHQWPLGSVWGSAKHEL